MHIFSSHRPAHAHCCFPLKLALGVYLDIASKAAGQLVGFLHAAFENLRSATSECIGCFEIGRTVFCVVSLVARTARGRAAIRAAGWESARDPSTSAFLPQDPTVLFQVPRCPSCVNIPWEHLRPAKIRTGNIFFSPLFPFEIAWGVFLRLILWSRVVAPGWWQESTQHFFFQLLSG